MELVDGSEFVLERVDSKAQSARFSMHIVGYNKK